jgi:hypothetical protein
MNRRIWLFRRPSKGWVVSAWRSLRAATIALSSIWFAYSTPGQGLRTVVESRDKVFPGVAAGVTAIKRDSSGRYYILAKPATMVSVYGPDGRPAGQIPNRESNGAVIRYAVDIDLNKDGALVVADRGANAIEVFAPDGALVSRTPIVAPTSVVALPDGQFAVTSLTSKRLVEVIDTRGRVLRSFGDPHDVGDQTPSADQPPAGKPPLMDFGRISGDSAGRIYFAFTSVTDPTLRKYDRYGYLGYETSLPERMFTGGDTRPIDRVQLSFGFSDASLEEQTSGFLTIGSANDAQFGGGVGTGLGEALRRGVGYDQALQQQVFQPGAGGGPFGAMFSGDVTNQGSNFQLGMGRMSAMGGRGRGRMSSGTMSDQTTNQGALLQFGSESDDATDSNSDSDQSSGTTAELGMFGAPDSGTSGSYNNYSGTAAQGLGAGGLPASFVLGSSFNTLGFRPRGLAGGPLDTTGTSGSASGVPGQAHPGAGPGGNTFGGKGADATTPRFNYHGGHFRSNSAAFTTTLKVNLGDLGKVSASDKPVITAMAVDPETQEIWAGIGDTLVHFSPDGNPAGIYYLMMAGATPLKPTALLVERDRILIASDPWGVFAFARPDKPASTPQPQLKVVPQVVPHE